VSCLKENAYGTPVYHLFVITTPRRNALMDYLHAQHIQTYIHYPLPVNKQKAFPGQKKEKFPNTENFADTILSIPLYPELTRENRETIVRVINDFNT
jgi:dTDP-4-amino-4,6-dideoxygalactose transaminase